MVGQKFSLNQQLKLEQTLSVQQIQSLELLQLPVLELQERLSQEMELNPLLEQRPPATEEFCGDAFEKADKAAEMQDNSELNEDDELRQVQDIMNLADSWHDYPPASRLAGSFNPEDEDKREYFFNSLVEESSLQDQLLEQLRFSDCSDETKGIATEIIGSIDDKGYLRSHLADISMSVQCSLQDASCALELVQSFDPPGIGARDLRECLKLQLNRSGCKDKNLFVLVDKYLELLATNHLPQIARELHISLTELNRLIEKIRELDPHPGAVLTPDSADFVVPELSIEQKEGKFVISSNQDYMPSLHISSSYLRMLESPDVPDEAKKYIREKLLNGKNLVKALEQRKSTIHRIAEIIIEKQKDFLLKGVDYLKPMTLQQVADLVGVHETTISRAVNGKYIQTPRGMFELKYFFSGGFLDDRGQEVSNRAVKDKIKRYIAAEDDAKPLSDSKLVKMLADDGLKVARRTVAKYRESMNIAASNLRRKYT